MIPDDFKWKKYVKLNPDIASYVQNKNQAIDHYLQYGVHENRKYRNKCQPNKTNVINSIQENKSGMLINQPKTYKKYESYEETIHWENKNILILIVSCKKNAYLWDKIKSRTNEKMITLCGLNHETNAYELNINTTYYNEAEKVLYLNCDDGYAGLPEKMALAIEYILQNFKDVTHILKIDDHDTYFTDDHIKNLYYIDELDHYHYIGQRQQCCTEPKFSNWHFGKIYQANHWDQKLAYIPPIAYFDGGSTYILSKPAMQIVNNVYNSSNIDKIRQLEIYEDVMIGNIMHNHKIKSGVINYSITGDK